MGPPRCRAADRRTPSTSAVLPEFVATRAAGWQRRRIGPQAYGRPRRRSSVSAAQVGGRVGTRAVARQEPVANHGQRVGEGRWLIQAASEIMLGWYRVTGDPRPQARLLLPPALGREGLGAHRRHWNLKSWAPTPRSAVRRRRARPLRGCCHDQRLPRLGDAGDRALADFAELADQNEMDHVALSAAVKTGRVKAQTELWSASASRFIRFG